jgi:hypothetical protein
MIITTIDVHVSLARLENAIELLKKRIAINMVGDKLPSVNISDRDRCIVNLVIEQQSVHDEQAKMRTEAA